ncbi:unnamed protein product [Amoebophrya sp. A25]|nr:unnamed protein product [Amoebophrya sp. A25]|eukprot:GSA25T00007596001.1
MEQPEAPDAHEVSATSSRDHGEKLQGRRQDASTANRGTDVALESAQMEVRLRQMAMELMEPTVLRAKVYEDEIEALKRKIEEQRLDISGLRDVARQASRDCKHIEKFREHLTKSDGERREHGTLLRDELRALEDRLRGMSLQREQHEGAQLQLERRLEQQQAEQARQYEEVQSLKRLLADEFARRSRELAEAQGATDVKFARQEHSLARIVDQHFETERQVANAARSLENTIEKVDAHAAELKELKATACDKSEVKTRFGNVFTRINALDEANAVLEGRIEESATSLKGHFETASNMIALNTSTLLKEARDEFQRKFQDNESSQKQLLEAMADLERRDFPRQHAELRRDMQEEVQVVREELLAREKKWQRDWNDGKMERQALLRRVETALAATQKVDANRERVGKILELMAEACDSVTALMLQDESDRDGISLLGLRDKMGEQQQGGLSSSSNPSYQNEADLDTSGRFVQSSCVERYGNQPGRPPAPDPVSSKVMRIRPKSPESRISPRKTFHFPGNSSTSTPSPVKRKNVMAGPSPRASSTASPPKRSSVTGGSGVKLSAGNKAAVSIDPRCLACSGQASQVLQGFKMACLHYVPSHVRWHRQDYSRRELLQLQQQLLAQARALRDCMERGETTEDFEFAATGLETRSTSSPSRGSRGSSVHATIRMPVVPKTAVEYLGRDRDALGESQLLSSSMRCAPSKNSYRAGTLLEDVDGLHCSFGAPGDSDSPRSAYLRKICPNVRPWSASTNTRPGTAGLASTRPGTALATTINSRPGTALSVVTRPNTAGQT